MSRETFDDRTDALALRADPAANLAEVAARHQYLIAVELDEPLVADAEVMRDLGQHHALDLALQALGILAVETFERAAVDRDLVRRNAAVIAASARQRHTLIQTE